MIIKAIRIKIYEIFITTKYIKKVFSGNKVKHSKRVARETQHITHSIEVYKSALYHDYLEKNGNINTLKSVTSEYSYSLILALSHNKRDDVLESIKGNLIGHNKQFINDVVVIKLCDRRDNLGKKFKAKTLSKDYIKKSIKLIQYLYDKYNGDKTLLVKFITNNIFPYSNKFYLKLNLS